MGVARFHLCTDCGKVVSDGAEGLRKHYDGADPTQEIGEVCPAMFVRACNWYIATHHPKADDEKGLERLWKVKTARGRELRAAAHAGRTLNVSGSPDPEKGSNGVSRRVLTADESAPGKSKGKKAARAVNPNGAVSAEGTV